jgi:hypothetical protein
MRPFRTRGQERWCTARAAGKVMGMNDERPLKLASDSEPGTIEPTPDEVESARLLANHTRDRLEAEGLDYETIRQLADEYIALHIGEDDDDFVRWASERIGISPKPDGI